jgi:hypothetical protein
MRTGQKPHGKCGEPPDDDLFHVYLLLKCSFSCYLYPMTVIQQTVEIDETRRVLRLEKPLPAFMGSGTGGSSRAGSKSGGAGSE